MGYFSNGAEGEAYYEEYCAKCMHCHQGALYTIVSGEGEDETEIGSAWGDLELTEDICDLMNMAYEAGKEAAEPFPPSVPEPWEPCTLVPHCSLSKGHEGDCID